MILSFFVLLLILYQNTHLNIMAQYRLVRLDS